MSKGIERISNPFVASGSSGLWNTYRGWRATIWYAPGGTASPRALLSSDWRGVIQTDYSASPDGRWVVIEMSGVGYMRILLRRPGGYVLRPLNPPPQFAAGGCPVWPDSRHCLFYCSSGAGTQGECWAYYPAEEVWRCVGRASNPESWMVRHDPVLRKSVIALRRFKHLPAAVVDDPVEALMRQDDWGNWPCAAAVFRGGQRAAVSFYDGIAHRWRVQVFDRRSAAPLARFSIAGAALFPGDPPSSPPSTHAWLSQLRIIDANDIGFTVVKLHLEGGVGGSRWHWDSQVHPSRFRTQMCEWNLKTGRVHTLGEGQDPLALPQPVVRRLLTRATGLVRAGRARSHPHRDPFSLN